MREQSFSSGEENYYRIIFTAGFSPGEKKQSADSICWASWLRRRTYIFPIELRDKSSHWRAAPMKYIHNSSPRRKKRRGVIRKCVQVYSKGARLRKPNEINYSRRTVKRKATITMSLMYARAVRPKIRKLRADGCIKSRREKKYANEGGKKKWTGNVYLLFENIHLAIGIVFFHAAARAVLRTNKFIQTYEKYTHEKYEIYACIGKYYAHNYAIIIVYT